MHRTPFPYCRNFNALLLMALGILALSRAKSQTCEQILQNARDLYQNGKIERVSNSMFSECFGNSDFTSENKVEAYKLIILSNIYRNQPDQAKEYAKSLLKVNPDYRLDEKSEPEEYVLLFKTLRRYPVYSVGVNLGLNTSYVDSYDNFSVDIGSRSDNYQNFTQVGIQTGVALSYNLSRDLLLHTGLNYQTIRFKIQNDGEDRLFNYAELLYDEQLTFVTLPLSMEIDFGTNYKYLYDLKVEKKKIHGFFTLGGEVRYLLDSRANLVRSDSLRSDIKFNDEVVKGMRQSLTFAAFAGAGIKYRIERGFLRLEARATYGLNNLTDGKKRYGNPKFIYQGGYLDDNYRLHALSLTIGYYRSIYVPK